MEITTAKITTVTTIDSTKARFDWLDIGVGAIEVISTCLVSGWLSMLFPSIL